MRDKIVIGLAMVMVFMCFAPLVLHGQTQSSKRVEWEYTWVQGYSNMNELGAKGWELVAISNGFWWYKRQK
jgi:hypothetical protein